MIVGTAGHIDHGKTALVKALTGIDTDRLAEEKRRGITIELGFAPLEIEGVGVVGIVDVPGHEDFVRSMLVGASGIDVGLLVIAADEGVMPQTREHLLILRLLRIPRLVVALTKWDLVDPEWIGLVRSDVELLLSSMSMHAAAIVACSASTRAGIDDLIAAISTSLRESADKTDDDIFRLPVDRVFTIRGTGTVVTGTVWSGALQSDASVRILPGDVTSRARRIEQHGRITDRAQPGTRTAVALAGLDPRDVPRGSTLVTDPAWRSTYTIEAVLELDEEMRANVSGRSQVRFHAGASETDARVVAAPGSGTEDGHTLARIALASPLALRGGDRFVLRLPAPVRTIGGGVVLDPYATRARGPQIGFDIERAADPYVRLLHILALEGTHGVALADIPVRVGCAPCAMADLISRSRAVATAHNLFSCEAVEQVMATVQRIVAEYEIKSPLSLGIPSRTLRERLRAPEELADVAIAELTSRGAIETEGPTIRRKGWTPTPSDADAETSISVAHDICAGEREPPSVSELVSRYGSSVPGLLRYLERQGRIVQVETERYYDREALDAMIARLKGSLEPGKVYATGQLRDVLGSSRKFLIPFLEFCDRSGVTERRGDGRMLRQTAAGRLDTSSDHS
ncbi:MAG TPA: selenocysteine-specific translation elongation factor [Gemmatimonadaceae bacterium]